MRMALDHSRYLAPPAAFVDWAVRPPFEFSRVVRDQKEILS